MVSRESDPTLEEGNLIIPGEEIHFQETVKSENRSLGAANMPFNSHWIQDHVFGGSLPPVGLKGIKPNVPWSEIWMRTEENEPNLVKSIVSLMDYDKMEMEVGRAFYLRKTLDRKEKATYVELLKEFLDVFAWSSSNLKDISSELDKHQIDLIEGAIPVRQHQYRLNPRYSMMMKEEINQLLEVGFIYPVINLESISPIVVVPK